MSSTWSPSSRSAAVVISGLLCTSIVMTKAHRAGCSLAPGREERGQALPDRKVFAAPRGAHDVEADAAAALHAVLPQLHPTHAPFHLHSRIRSAGHQLLISFRIFLGGFFVVGFSSCLVKAHGAAALNAVLCQLPFQLHQHCAG